MVSNGDLLEFMENQRQGRRRTLGSYCAPCMGNQIYHGCVWETLMKSCLRVRRKGASRA
jgi:hypothetical protein